MIVNNENYKQVFEIFKQTCDIAKFASFDCEMTGLSTELKNEHSKYDSQDFRYYKVKNGVEKFDLIQFGLTFFIEKEKIKNENENKLENNTEQYYLERSFTFYLFKNPQNKYFMNEKNSNIFNIESLAHPASLKFLKDNKFDFNALISKGIPFLKLSYSDKIKNYLIKESTIINDCSFFLNTENEKDLVENIIKLTDFLLLTKIEKGKKKPSLLLKFIKKETMAFFLGYNFKLVLFIDNFNMQKLKSEENIVEVKITKEADESLFEINYNSIDNFKNLLRNNPKMIYELKYQPQNKLDVEKNDINKLVEEELGFTKYIKYLSDKKIPIIGHNIYFDTMFIYHKLIADLPDDFYTFKTEIHKYFPIIYDTKSISVALKVYEKTSLDSLHRIIIKNKYDTYVSFVEDIENGFNLYNNDVNKEKLHDAGYDSKITGECFVLMNKALENNYTIKNKNNETNNKKKKKAKNEEKNQNNNDIIIKYGFCNLDLFEQFKNISFISLVSPIYGKVIWDIDMQSKEEYNKMENNFINSLKNIFIIRFKWDIENSYLINNYEIANLFKNNFYNLYVTKIDYDKCFIEFLCNDNIQEKDLSNILNILTETKKNNNILNNKLIIDDIYPYENFISQFKDFLK